MADAAVSSIGSTLHYFRYLNCMLLVVHTSHGTWRHRVEYEVSITPLYMYVAAAASVQQCKLQIMKRDTDRKCSISTAVFYTLCFRALVGMQLSLVDLRSRRVATPRRFGSRQIAFSGKIPPLDASERRST